jgi:endonuclease G, mitochondrial
MPYRFFIKLSFLFFVLSCGTSAEYIHFRASSNFEDSRLVEHDCFTILYSDKCKQAHWVAYTLHKASLSGEAQRKDNFRPDPNIPADKSAQLSDYRSSGYDRGHLAPAADMRVSQNCMDDSFYFSNISPQVPTHNRGVWKRLEDQVRHYAEKFDSVVVVTGPVLQGDLELLGDNEVCIPKLYYKALLVKDSNGFKTIGFVVPNEGSNAELRTFALTIDELEQLTGIDFFPYIPVQIQKSIEAAFDFDDW